MRSDWSDEATAGMNRRLAHVAVALTVASVAWALIAALIAPGARGDHPAVVGGAPSRVSATQARVEGRVTPGGLPTSFYIEYGETTAYGQSVPSAHDGDAGGGVTVVPIAATLTGLAPNTAYHYRIVAANSDGTTTSGDHVFHTATMTPAPGVGVDGERTLELVSAADKNQNIVSYGKFSTDNTRVLYTVAGGTPESTSGATSWLLAQRTSAGWVSRNVLPPDSDLGDGSDYHNPFITSLDLSSSVAGIWASINGHRPSPVTAVKLDEHGNQRILQLFPDVGQNEISTSPQIASSDDLSHIFLNSPNPLVAGHVSGTDNVYDFGGATPVLVSRLPDGSVPACGVRANGAISGFAQRDLLSSTSQHWASEDGSKVFFEAVPGSDCGAARELYLRDLATDTTTLISGPVIAGGDAGVGSAGPGLLQAAPDASWVIYRSSTQLDAADTNGDPDIYRYDTGSGENSCLTCMVADANVGVTNDRAMASQNGAYVYFESDNALTPDAAPGPGMYAVHAGAINYVAPFFGGLAPATAGGSDLTPDGTVLVFGDEQDGVTGDDIASSACGRNCREYYRYDARDGTVMCISCPSGTPSSSVFTQLAPLRGGDTDIGHALSGDGSTFVFRTTEALVPQDTNSDADLYEWRDGHLGLITDGRTVGQFVVLGDVSADGRDVLFTSTGKQRPDVPDDATQLYDARLGGGFAPAPASAVCDSDQCQGAPSPPPSLSDPGSLLVSGNQAARSRSGAFAVGRVSGAQAAAFGRTGRLRLRVRVGSAGKVTVSATARFGGRMRAAGGAVGVAAKAQAISLDLRLSHAALVQLIARKRLSVTVTIRFSRSRVAKHFGLKLKAHGAKHVR